MLVNGFEQVYINRDRNSHRISDIVQQKNVRCLALMYQSRTFCSAIYHWVPYVENLFSISYMAYSKSIKSLSTFIHQAINKGEHTHRHLPLFTFTLISGDTWWFCLFKVFSKNIKSTCMTWILLICFLSWIRFF